MFIGHITVIAVLFLSLICAHGQTSRLLVISLDGFRHDYLKEHNLPNLQQFSSEGIRTSHGMQPSFTTLTFPNHISLATGMYQEEHGIVANKFYDQLLKKNIEMSSRDEGQWADPKVEPMWITATKQKKKTAVLFWPACANEFHGVRPLIYSWTYSDLIPFREKIDNSLNYFHHLSMDLVMLYHFEPDKQGHNYGPDSPQLHDALVRLDGDIKYLMDRVKAEFNDSINIMIVSDHGMANVTKIIRPFTDGFIQRASVDTNYLSGALLNVRTVTGKKDEVINGLMKIPDVTVYKREEMPERFHYSKVEHRLGDVVVVPNKDGIIFNEGSGTYPNIGNHGWDDTFASMQAIFMARGPAFTSNTEIHSLKNVDVYHIVCRILGITPNSHATAGSLNNLTHIFKKDPTTTTTTIPDRFTTTTVGLNSATLPSIFVSYWMNLVLLLLLPRP